MKENMLDTNSYSGIVLMVKAHDN